MMPSRPEGGLQEVRMYLLPERYFQENKMINETVVHSQALSDRYEGHPSDDIIIIISLKPRGCKGTCTCANMKKH